MTEMAPLPPSLPVYEAPKPRTHAVIPSGIKVVKSTGELKIKSAKQMAKSHINKPKNRK